MTLEVTYKIKDKIRNSNRDIKISNNNTYFKLENNIILKYISDSTYYKIFNLDGEDMRHEVFESFNKCLVVIALDLGRNDSNLLNYLNIKWY